MFVHILENLNTNISHQPFNYKITFVKSQHMIKNSKVIFYSKLVNVCFKDFWHTKINLSQKYQKLNCDRVGNIPARLKIFKLFIFEKKISIFINTSPNHCPLLTLISVISKNNIDLKILAFLSYTYVIHAHIQLHKQPKQFQNPKHFSTIQSWLKLAK